MAFLYARAEDEDKFVVEEMYRVPEEHLDHSSRYFISLTDEGFTTVMKKAARLGLVPIEVHSHRDKSFEPGFSGSDFEGFEDTVPHVRWRLQGRPYMAMVFAPSGYDALIWRGEAGEVEGLDAMVIDGELHKPSGTSLERIQPAVDERRYNRQLPLFGKEGQRKVRNTEVAIVGLGGLGSHLAQQLAYLGVRKFRLLDGDVVEHTNLNRLIGAGPTDAEEQRSKVKVSRRLIHSVAPDTEVVTCTDYFVTEEGFEHLREVDVIFGTVDNDASRSILNRFAQAYNIPYMDLATGVHADRNHFGGRVLFSVEGERCLYCEGLLDQGAIDSLLAPEGQRKDKAEVYGVPEEELGNETGPSVVSINGTIASLAATEFLAHITGNRPPETYLRYDGSYRRGTGVRSIPSNDNEDCYFCDNLLEKERDAGIEQKYRGELGERLQERLERS